MVLESLVDVNASSVVDLGAEECSSVCCRRPPTAETFTKSARPEARHHDGLLRQDTHGVYSPEKASHCGYG